MVMVSVMMVPSRVMPGMIPVVNAAMMRVGVTSPTMVGRSGMAVACMSMMPMPAVAVRSMTCMSVPAMSALAKGRNSIAQNESNHHCQSQQTENSHHFEAFILWPINRATPDRNHTPGAGDNRLSPVSGAMIVILQ
jgi:hypothetical protein